MSGLLRYTQKLFGINAAANQMSQYGSKIASPPGNRYSGATINPDIVQSLATFGQGQYAAMAGAKSPFIPDHNSLFYLAFYQLSYLLTRGIPDWDAGTTYNTNDFCKVGNIQYYSLIDSNMNNNPASNPSDWKSNIPIIPTKQTFTSGSGIYHPTISSGQKPIYAIVTLIGAGGGGQGSANNGGTGGNGANGGTTSLGIYSISGGGGASSSGPGIGYQNGGDAIDVDFSISLPGSYGIIGADGGGSLFGGAGKGGGFYTQIGGNGQFGGGGGGAYSLILSSTTIDMLSTAAGASGFYDQIIVPITAIDSQNYSIGVGGAGGLAGVGGFNGGDGGEGYLQIEEFYQ